MVGVTSESSSHGEVHHGGIHGRSQGKPMFSGYNKGKGGANSGLGSQGMDGASVTLNLKGSASSTANFG